MSAPAFREYPYIPTLTDEEQKELLREICSLRKEDIGQIANLINIFWQGRSVGKIPTDSNDVDEAVDKIGDLSYDADYMYILVNDSGAGKWRRISLGVF